MAIFHRHSPVEPHNLISKYPSDVGSHPPIDSPPRLLFREQVKTPSLASETHLNIHNGTNHLGDLSHAGNTSGATEGPGTIYRWGEISAEKNVR